VQLSDDESFLFILRGGKERKRKERKMEAALFIKFARFNFSHKKSRGAMNFYTHSNRNCYGKSSSLCIRGRRCWKMRVFISLRSFGTSSEKSPFGGVKELHTKARAKKKHGLGCFLSFGARRQLQATRGKTMEIIKSNYFYSWEIKRPPGGKSVRIFSSASAIS